MPGLQNITDISRILCQPLSHLKIATSSIMLRLGVSIELYRYVYLTQKISGCICLFSLFHKATSSNSTPWKTRLLLLSRVGLSSFRVPPRALLAWDIKQCYGMMTKLNEKEKMLESRPEDCRDCRDCRYWQYYCGDCGDCVDCGECGESLDCWDGWDLKKVTYWLTDWLTYWLT